MLTIHGRAAKLCDGISRREMLRVGGLSVLGLSLPSLLQATEAAPLGVLPTDKTFGRAKNVIFLYLAGGPPQHETFDPKPDAPAEVRGVFKPISTNVPGIQFCELLPRTARIADKLAVVRSLSTNDNNHDSSGYWVLTGYQYQGPNSRTIQPTDWPYFGSIVKMKKPSDVLPPLSTVWIPDMMRLNENVTPAGQTGGISGSQWDPDRFVGDPSDAGYKIEGLRLTDLPPLRLQQRESLLAQLEQHFAAQQRGDALLRFDSYQRQAYELLTSGRAREAFDIQQEPDKVRDRYGRNRWGQCVLLARRLVEAGVRLVHVQWPREPGDNAVDNPLWDTHAQNADRLEDVLCPQFDVGFTALIEDLDQRGLLDETLVVAIGEFGRTPKINDKGGRDHWGPVFSFALAGAGISGGQVYGSSDKQGAYPASDRVEPGELTATIFHLLGLSHRSIFLDREGREHRITQGEPLYKLLGTEPATRDRCPSTGDVARVPPFDDRKLLNADFAAAVPLYPADGPSRPRGWRAAPLLAGDQPNGFGVKLVESAQSSPPAGARDVTIGLSTAGSESPLKIEKGVTAYLAQEVRSPFAGHYKLTARVRGDGSSSELYDNIFCANFTFRLVFFQFTDVAKQPTHRKELASLTIRPRFAGQANADYETFELAKDFVNATPGSNFSFGLGLGVALLVEKTTDGVLEVSGDSGRQHALLRIASVELEFAGKERNNDVKV
jgi:hypothetical protein